MIQTLLRVKPIHGVATRQNLQLRIKNQIQFSSTVTTDDTTSTKEATIVQGPSLLTNTGHARPSPSLFFLPGLRSLPFWTAPHETNNADEDSKARANKSKIRIAYNDPTVSQIVHHLEENYKTIRDEYMSGVLGIQSPSSPLITSTISLDQHSHPNVSSSSFRVPLQPDYDINSKGFEHTDSTSQSLHEGQWDWHSYIQNGKKSSKFQSHCPKTAQIINDIGDQHLFADVQGVGNNPFGFCFFSTLSGQSKIKPHCGPMNLRLRIHLPLIVPSPLESLSTSTSLTDKNDKNDKPTNVKSCGLRVGNQTRQWIPGKAVVLDDSYEHEVWNDTMEPRVLLLVDIWHPDVLQEEKQRILQMFDFAKDQGWIGKK